MRANRCWTRTVAGMQWPAHSQVPGPSRELARAPFEWRSARFECGLMLPTGHPYINLNMNLRTAPKEPWRDDRPSTQPGFPFRLLGISTFIHDIFVRTPDSFVATSIQLPIPVSSGRARRGTDWSPDSRAFFRHLCALAPFFRQMFSVSGHPLSVRHRQRPDPPLTCPP